MYTFEEIGDDFGTSYWIVRSGEFSIPYNCGKISTEEYKGLEPELREAFMSWYNISRTARKKMKLDYITKQGGPVEVQKYPYTAGTTVALADIQRAQMAMLQQIVFENMGLNPHSTGVKPQSEVQENTMDNNTAQAREHLKVRVRETYYELERKLQMQFFLIEDNTRRTAQDWVEMVKNDKITLPKTEARAKMSAYDFWANVQWRAPEDKPDQEGFKVAVDLLKTAFKKTTDYVMVKEPIDALVDFEAFEKWTLPEVTPTV